MNNGLKIIGATLLSLNEADQLPSELRKYHNWWWLRNSSYIYYRAACVDHRGYFIDGGYFVDDYSNVVRPALQIKKPNSSNLKIGDVFEFGGKTFKIISNNLAFCLSDIGTCAFRRNWKAEDANDYEKSDVKKYVDEWFVDSMTPYEETPIPAQLSTEEQVKNMGSNYESITFAKNNYDSEEQMWDDIRDTIRILSKQGYQFKFYCDGQGIGIYVLEFNYLDAHMCGVNLEWTSEDME